MTASPASFAEFPLPPPLLTALNDVGYESPSPIQAAAIPVLLAGGDLIGQAQTGTGKTAAFALPLLARLDFQQREPQVLVLTPTRELAIQVAEAFQSYARHLPGFHVLPIYGGQSMGLQLRGLQRAVHVIVGTPGRVMDHLRRASLDLSRLRALVLDEADEMLRMGFLEEVSWILEHTPGTRQTALFSATMPAQIRAVAEQHLKSPAEISIRSRTSTVEAIRQRYWQVGGLHKLDALTRMLEVEDIDAAIVFVRTKIATVELAEKLEARGYACAALNGDLNQAQREKTIEQLKNGQLDIVIATDVAARGLDVPRISHVINYDIPYDIEGYVHRIGRTGRAGRTGEAILFVAHREMRMLRAIERATRQPIEPMRAPSRAAIVDRRIAQFKQTVFDTLASEDMAFFAELIDEMAHERGVEAREIAAALACLVQRDRPLRLEMAEEAPVREPRAERDRRAPPAGRDGSAPGRSRPPRDERAPRRPRANPPTDADTAAPRPPREFPRQGGERPPRRNAAAAFDAARGGESPLRRARETRRPPGDAAAAAGGGDLVPYRLDVGRAHGATPKHIVGALANEGGIDTRHIGRIDLHEDFSTVELPAAMPPELLQHLRRVRFGRQRFNLTPLTEPQRRGLADLSAESARVLRGSPKPRKKRPT
ncbi:MAG: DEAD/DEAH box helicase [Candidatus Binatia bacterium]